MKMNIKFRSVSITKETLLTILYLIILCIGIIGSYSSSEKEVVATSAMPLSKKVVLIDAGHGGWDPGKVGENGVLEKDINLRIAEKLQSYLEQGDSYVLVTRLEDEALGERKMADMGERKAIANYSDADILISIHQNSYTKPSVYGAQAFYYGESEQSKSLAECIQKQLKSFLGQETNRNAKANSDYYILKQTTMPTVIVECGFLSNPEEGALLSDEDYQEKVAWGIYLGIVEYFNSMD